MDAEATDIWDSMLEASGEWFTVSRLNLNVRIQGVRNRDNATGRSYVEFPYNNSANLKAGDVLVSETSGEGVAILGINMKVMLKQIFSVRAFYKTPYELEIEKKIAQGQGPTFNIGTAHGSIIGIQQTATIHNKFDFAALDAEIDKRGGSDTAELKAMIEEIKDTLLKDEKLPGGVLARFSSQIERHAWIAEPIAHLTLLWSLGKFGAHFSG